MFGKQSRDARSRPQIEELISEAVREAALLREAYHIDLSCRRYKEHALQSVRKLPAFVYISTCKERNTNPRERLVWR